LSNCEQAARCLLGILQRTVHRRRPWQNKQPTITSIDEVVKIMEEKRLLDLSLKVNGKVTYSIARHDLLRAWIGLGMDIETNMA
jgi:hypothetical protein